MQIRAGDRAASVPDARRGSRQRGADRAAEWQLSTWSLHEGGRSHAPLDSKYYQGASRCPLTYGQGGTPAQEQYSKKFWEKGLFAPLNQGVRER